MKAQEILMEEYYDLILNAELKQSPIPISYNHAVDVGTSKTRGISFISNSNSVNPDDIIRVPNEFALLTIGDVNEALKMEYDKLSFNNLMLFKMQNVTNDKSPLHGKPLFIAKGLTGDKLLKTSNYSVSNTSKFKQTNEYVINTYISIITTIYTNIVKYLEADKREIAEKFLNVQVNLACMLPDEEKNSFQAETLLETLKGVVEYELPLFGGLKGRITLNNTANQRLDMYGEAESVIYYFIIKNRTPEVINAFTNHGVVVADIGEGSFDTVFFKQRELITRASSTSRAVNGSILVSRLISNIERKTHNEGKLFSPSEEMIKKVLDDNEPELILKTPRREYDITESLNEVKAEMSSEIANVFKNALEKNSVFGGVDNLFLVIFAGRTMVHHGKSPSLGNYIANQLERQLDIPPEICKVTHPDSNILGAALRMLMYLNR